MFHRYMLGVYELYSRLAERFPDILFESCASGGARFDAGLLAWAPQAWTSDDTDAVERLRDPVGHVARLPALVDGRARLGGAEPPDGPRDAAVTRAAVAMFGAFGYELDPTAMPDEEQAEVARQVAWYVERRELFQHGRFLRLRSPFEGDGNETAWMAVDDEGSQAVVGFYRVLARPLPVRKRIRLRGLDPAATYRVTTWMDSFAAPDATVDRAGDELMAVGLGIEPPDMPIPRGESSDGTRHRARRLPGPPVRRVRR